MSPLEQLAHDVICIIKYGSPGGSTNSAEVKRVAEYLKPHVRTAPPAPPALHVALPAPTPKLPTIRLP